jgi:predicted dehydrogenase
MGKETVNIAVVGCGDIANGYAKTLQPYPHIRLLGATSLHLQRAQEYVEKYGGRVYASLAEILADEQVDIVVNLTIHQAHYEIIKQCLLAGKHVYSEKPLALSAEESWELVNLAQEKNVRLSCAPMTILGEGQQTAWKYIREGKLGPVRLAYVEVNWGRIESWHPGPEPFYEVGVLFDVGVYPLTILTAIFGPARRVTGYGHVLLPDRVTKKGRAFHIETSDFVVAAIEFANGSVARLTANFYVKQSHQRGIEFHGDRGSFYLGDFQGFDGPLAYAEFGQRYQEVPYIKEPYHETEWARGIAELADAIQENRPQRITGAQAAHVVDILCATRESLTTGHPIIISSECPPVEPMSWAL